MRRVFCVLMSLACMVAADPCGMVPPIYTGEGPPITRVGVQKTYVFYKDGIESFVIRPGYSGKVGDFGMLIPFPTPPALRKLPDNIFGQLAAAVDPPEVVEWIYDPDERVYEMSAAVGDSEQSLGVNEVAVLRQEAVGMYEIAVLAAGSPEALALWMEEHGYRYPQGMDKACAEYIADGWCFVAVKTRVGPKAGVDPDPGMRTTQPGLPDGASFDGNVQAMGFRFRSPELVVPMRLSAFNKGEMRNVVYLLSDAPQKVQRLPEGHVVRQLPGAELRSHLTELLPLRVVGGSVDDISAERWQQLLVQRDPKPHNGLAAELFAADLLAAREQRLAHPHEEQEKRLLSVGEALGLRGEEMDRLHHEALLADHEAVVARALAELDGMWLTVIDGDFPREVVAEDNLHFEAFRMPGSENTAERYEATSLGPQAPREGTVFDGEEPPARLPSAWWLLALPVPLLVYLYMRRRRG